MSDLSLPGCLCIPFVYRSATKHRLTPPTVQSRLQARSAAYAIAPAEGRGASPVGKAFGPRRRMKRLEDQGAVERVVVPDTDDAMPTKPCRKHSSWSLPPGNVRHRLAATRLVLTYTKPPPPTVAGTQDLLPAS
jgi:hypothetical protein